MVAELEEVIAQVKKEKAEVEKALDRRQDLLDESVGKIEEMEHAVTTEHKRASFSTMKMLLAFSRTREQHAR